MFGNKITEQVRRFEQGIKLNFHELSLKVKRKKKFLVEIVRKMDLCEIRKQFCEIITHFLCKTEIAALKPMN